MNWPNKISIPEPQMSYLGNKKYFELRKKIEVLEKWCLNNISSQGVLWTYDVENLPGQDLWSFYFAHEEDAVLFRLTHGV